MERPAIDKATQISDKDQARGWINGGKNQGTMNLEMGKIEESRI
jgi:hypothetical protein